MYASKHTFLALSYDVKFLEIDPEMTQLLPVDENWGTPLLCPTFGCACCGGTAHGCIFRETMFAR